MSTPTTPPGYDELQAALRDNWAEPSLSAQTQSRVLSELQSPQSSSQWSRFTVVAMTALVAAVIVLVVTLRSPALPSDADTDTMRAVVLVSDAELRIAPGSVVEVLRDDRNGTVLLLKQGTLWSHVDKREHDRPFAVQAGDVTIEVVGTIFSVSMDTDKTVRVDAIEGTVRVRNTVGEQLLHAPALWDAKGDGVSKNVASESITSEIASVMLDASMPFSAPDLTTPSEPDVVHPTEAASEPKATPRKQYREAKAWEAAGATGKALRRYRAVAATKSELAEDALYALARLELAQGQRKAYESSLVRYRKRYPHGRYLQAVYVHLLGLWQSVPKREPQLRALANEFLRRFQDDSRAKRFESWLQSHPIFP